ncbi:bifunctional nuclease family protein [Haloferula chungangensis]|uniref:Bifunctional nuclease family protein n=1 Tax=Haloferula chungangensis TaxID=1048331 RepID=A0ABW2L9B1_9BACT
MPDLVRVEPIALLPTPAGCAVFLGDGKKAIVFYIDIAIGASINAAMAGQTPPRPLTHDLFLNAMEGFGAKISRAVIIAVEEEVYFARLILEAENEIMERKIVEIDARPSDCIALAVRSDCPIYVLKDLWEGLQDMSSALEEMRSKGMDLGGE